MGVRNERLPPMMITRHRAKVLPIPTDVVTTNTIAHCQVCKDVSNVGGCFLDDQVHPSKWTELETWITTAAIPLKPN